MLKTAQYSDLFAPLKPYLSSVVNLGSISILSFSGDEIPNQKEFTAMMNCSQPFVLFCIKGKISFETPYLALGIEPGEFVLSVGTILKTGFGTSSSFRIIIPGPSFEKDLSKLPEPRIFDSAPSLMHLSKHPAVLSREVFSHLDEESADSFSGPLRDSFSNALLCSIRFDALRGTSSFSDSASLSERIMRNFLSFLSLLGRCSSRHHNLEFYASYLGLTQKHLIKVAQLCSPLTAHRWLERFILFNAEYLLLRTKMSPSEVGQSLSFSSPSYFGQFFKRLKGISPGEFRQNFRKNGIIL